MATPVMKITKSSVGFISQPAHLGDAGYDLHARKDYVLCEHDQMRIKTGVRVAIPLGLVGLICPRSGLADKHGITVLNAPGVIDSGFRGEIEVILVNHSDDDKIIRLGDKIAQLVLVPTVFPPEVEWVDELPDSHRGAEGFGSTGD